MSSQLTPKFCKPEICGWGRGQGEDETYQSHVRNLKNTHTHTHTLPQTFVVSGCRSIFIYDCFRNKISSSPRAQQARVILVSEQTIIFDLRGRQGIESQTAESFLSPHWQSWKRFSQSVSGLLFGALYHFGFSQCVFKLWVTSGSLPDWHNSPRHSDRSSASEEE